MLFGKPYIAFFKLYEKVSIQLCASIYFVQCALACAEFSPYILFLTF